MPLFIPRNNPARRGQTGGFTLVELLVVIAIIGVLVGLLMPALSAVMSLARRSECTKHMQQIGFALGNYHSTHQVFPPGCVEPNERRHAWSTFILPDMEQLTLWESYDWNLRFDAEENRAVTNVVLPIYLCPSTSRRMTDRQGDFVILRSSGGDSPETSQESNSGTRGLAGMACSDYGGMFGDGRPQGRRQRTKPMNGMLVWDASMCNADVLDGTTYTIIVAEDTGRGAMTDGQWSNGENIFDIMRGINQIQDNEIWSDHSGGANVLMCAGNVHFLSDSIEIGTLGALCTRAGREGTEAAEIGK